MWFGAWRRGSFLGCPASSTSLRYLAFYAARKHEHLSASTFEEFSDMWSLRIPLRFCLVLYTLCIAETKPKANCLTGGKSNEDGGQSKIFESGKNAQDQMES